MAATPNTDAACLQESNSWNIHRTSAITKSNPPKNQPRPDITDPAKLSMKYIIVNGIWIIKISIFKMNLPTAAIILIFRSLLLRFLTTFEMTTYLPLDMTSNTASGHHVHFLFLHPSVIASNICLWTSCPKDLSSIRI